MSLAGNRKAAAPLALLTALVCANIPPFRLCWAITLCLLCHIGSKHRAQLFPPSIERCLLQDLCCISLLVDPACKLRADYSTGSSRKQFFSLVQTDTCTFCKDKLGQLSPFSFPLHLYKFSILTKTAKSPGQFSMPGYHVGKGTFTTSCCPLTCVQDSWFQVTIQ